jgi:hypothetical protein
MFDKIRNKWNKNSRRPSAQTGSSGRTTETDDIQAVSVAVASRLSANDRQTRPRSSSTASTTSSVYSFDEVTDSNTERNAGHHRGRASLSVPNYQRTTSTSQDRRKDSSAFWLAASEDGRRIPSRDGSRVRAKSQSISIPHREIVEEQMRSMPYSDWRAKRWEGWEPLSG